MEVQHIKALMQSGEFNLALEKIEKHKALNANLLVWKSLCIQMSQGTQRYSLEDAKTALLDAVELDTEHEEPRRELAWFLFSVEDDAEGALILFREVMEANNNDLADSLSGYIKASKELNADFSASSAIEELISSLSNHPALQEL